MDQVLLSRILILNFDYPLTNKFFVRILSNIPVLDFSSTEPKDDQEIESFAKDRVDGHEIHAVLRIPISLQESCP